MIRKVTLKQVGYRITGTAYLKSWGGGEGTIEMDAKEIKGKITKDRLLNCINDGQFGCEKILNADIDVYDLFENHYTELNRTIYAGERQCKNAMRGI